MSKQEALAVARRMFDLMDADRDGIVDKTDLDLLDSVIADMFGSMQGEGSYRKSFLKEVMDKDCDGAIDVHDIEELCLTYFC